MFLFCKSHVHILHREDESVEINVALYCSWKVGNLKMPENVNKGKVLKFRGYKTFIII